MIRGGKIDAAILGAMPWSTYSPTAVDWGSSSSPRRHRGRGPPEHRAGVFV